MRGAQIAKQQTFDACRVFGDVFQLLLNVRELSTTPGELGSRQSKKMVEDLGLLTLAYEKELDALPRFGPYSRHIIGREKNWTGLICRWEKHVSSSIHGHPAFAYYQVLEGCIDMDFFEPINDFEARKVSSKKMCTGDAMFSTAGEDRYDNLIHRVRTLESPVFTLHLYSDNPAKGRVFKIAK